MSLAALALVAAVAVEVPCVAPPAAPQPKARAGARHRATAATRSLHRLKPLEPNCDEPVPLTPLETALQEIAPVPLEPAPFTPVLTWPAPEELTPTPAETCDCFARYIPAPGAPGGGGFSGGVYVVARTVVPAVPEPATLGLLGVGLVALLGRRLARK